MFFKQFLLFFVGVNPIFVCLINHIYSIAYLFVKSQVLFSHSSQGLKTLEFSGKILINNINDYRFDDFLISPFLL